VTPVCSGQRVARRVSLWRRVAAPICLSLAAPATQAAAYLPGAEPDPPTGDAGAASASAAEPLRANGGNGIQWRFAPWRWGGTLALDARWLKLEDGSAARQGALFADIDGSTYLWQPWFVQLRLGAGVVVSRDSSDAGGASRQSGGNAYTARAQVGVFPASRFPFEMRAEVSDSRTGGENLLGQDRRTHRFAISQSWRPETGSDQYQVHVDASHLFGPEGRDSLVVLDGSAQLQRGPHRFEFGLNRADNHRGDDSDRALTTTLTARHGYHPRSELDVDSLASWNRARVHATAQGDDDGLSSEVRQLSTLLTWRPRAGDLPFALPSSTLVVGSARWVEQRLSGGGELSASALNATLGASAELTPDWRASLSGSVNQFELGGDREPIRSATLAASATWAPRAIAWGAPGTWRWSPSAAWSASLTRASGAGDRNTVGTQFSHSLSRDWLRGAGDAISFNFSQSAALQAESDADVRTRTRALAHSVGLVWQDAGDGARQQYASVSASDSRSFGDDGASFQLVNLQWSRRTQLSRLASWSGNVTLQFSRSTARDDRPSSAPSLVTTDPGWQRFATGHLSYEQQRFWGVPRLRFTLLAGVSTQQIERRSAGDIDASLERVSRSIEARWDYQIGRLDARLSARAAHVDDRSVASLVARVQRRF
jgi:hypothetical protein